jgi:hypothetical protein
MDTSGPDRSTAILTILGVFLLTNATAILSVGPDGKPNVAAQWIVPILIGLAGQPMTCLFTLATVRIAHGVKAAKAPPVTPEPTPPEPSPITVVADPVPPAAVAVPVSITSPPIADHPNPTTRTAPPMPSVDPGPMPIPANLAPIPMSPNPALGAPTAHDDHTPGSGDGMSAGAQPAPAPPPPPPPAPPAAATAVVDQQAPPA